MGFMRKDIRHTNKYYEENEEETNEETSEVAVAFLLSVPAVIMGVALMFFILIDRISASFI